MPWDSAYMTDAAIEHLRRNAEEERPYFLHVNYLPPHHPYEKYPEALGVYSKVQGTLRANAEAVDGHASGDVAMYMNLVRGIDIEVGRVLAELDALESEAVVVFTSDHGDMLGSHGMTFKRKPHEESARVPLIVRGAGWTPGLVNHPVGLVDLARTICDLGQGTDLREPRDSVYYEMAQPLGSWAGGEWRALVTDGRYDAIFDVDLATGNRQFLGEHFIGSGDHFFSPQSSCLSGDGSELYVADIDRSAVYRVDAATGKRTVLAGSGVGSGVTAKFYWLWLDTVGDRLLAGNSNSVQEINRATPSRISVWGRQPSIRSALPISAQVAGTSAGCLASNSSTAFFPASSSTSRMTSINTTGPSDPRLITS